jgi:hypothetical protein
MLGRCDMRQLRPRAGVQLGKWVQSLIAQLTMDETLSSSELAHLPGDWGTHRVPKLKAMTADGEL